MTTEELLKPRFKVIADYPSSPFKLGDVLYYNDKLSILTYHPNTDFPHHADATKYPAIFQPLQWWEAREEDIELGVEYLKAENSSNPRVWKIDDWVTLNYKGVPIVQMKDIDGNPRTYGLAGFIPATKEEYEAYISGNAPHNQRHQSSPDSPTKEP